MHYTRLAIVAVVLVALVFWLHQCSAPDATNDMQGTLDKLRNQTETQTQGTTNGTPPAVTTQTQKPASGN